MKYIRYNIQKYFNINIEKIKILSKKFQIIQKFQLHNISSKFILSIMMRITIFQPMDLGEKFKKC